MILPSSNIAIIAPHPDDETISMGGSIARLADQGCNISILVVSGHLPPLYSDNSFQETEQEAKKAFKLLGVSHFEFAKIPATYIHQKPTSEINNLIYK